MIYLQLFWAFFRVGLYTFGGGYAMLPMMERLIAHKKGWATTAEIAELFALGQVLPGIVSVNTATFIGIKVGNGKKGGVLGGIAATLGVIAPSLIIATTVAAFYDAFMSVELIRNAFSGVFIAACALVLAAVYKIFRACVQLSEKLKSLLSLTLLTGSFTAIVFFGVSPVWVVIAVALIALATSLVRRRKAK
ncbi:MAG: chromate transporter [Oscillospiraceae bacterium]|nr:chromate transporter [Oscillospiraceae bacterium]